MKERRPFTKNQQEAMIAYAMQHPTGVPLTEMAQILGQPSKQTASNRYHALRRDHPELPPILSLQDGQNRSLNQRKRRKNSRSLALDERIRQLRNAGLTYAEISPIVNLSVQSVGKRAQRLEREGQVARVDAREKKRPSEGTLRRLARAQQMKEENPKMTWREIGSHPEVRMEASNLATRLKHGEWGAAKRMREKRQFKTPPTE